MTYRRGHIERVVVRSGGQVPSTGHVGNKRDRRRVQRVSKDHQRAGYLVNLRRTTDSCRRLTDQHHVDRHFDFLIGSDPQKVNVLYLARDRMDGHISNEAQRPIDQDVLERLDWVRRELRGLDRVAAEIIELRFRAGLTLEAIGQRLGLTVGAVHGRLMRAVSKLRRKAGELGDE